MEATHRSLLIIFYRNPVKGKVKTRLAATMGSEKALEIYNRLTLHTKEVTEKLPVEKIVFYSDSIDLMDVWSNAIYMKALQDGDDLGQRMERAFQAGFEAGYDSICIIGTDCYELTTRVILKGFEALSSADVVIGPARDGGYYLLGMKKLCKVFNHKRWGSETVLQDTLRDIETLELSYLKLEELGDVDIEDDLPDELKDGPGA